MQDLDPIGQGPDLEEERQLGVQATRWLQDPIFTLVCNEVRRRYHVEFENLSEDDLAGMQRLKSRQQALRDVLDAMHEVAEGGHLAAAQIRQQQEQRARQEAARTGVVHSWSRELEEIMGQPLNIEDEFS